MPPFALPGTCDQAPRLLQILSDRGVRVGKKGRMYVGRRRISFAAFERQVARAVAFYDDGSGRVRATQPYLLLVVAFTWSWQ